MVDIFILLSHLSRDVSNNLWRSLRYVSHKTVASFEMLKCHLSGQRDAKLFSFYRQTVLQDGVVFYLAIWEVLRQGNMINNLF